MHGSQKQCEKEHNRIAKTNEEDSQEAIKFKASFIEQLSYQSCCQLYFLILYFKKVLKKVLIPGHNILHPF